MDLYLLDVSPLENSSVFKAYYDKCPTYRKSKIDACKKHSSRMLSLGAEILISHGMKKNSITDYSILISRTGKPYEKERKIHFSISHSGKYAAAVFSNAEIGVDIEAARNVDLKIAERFFDKTEQMYINNAEEKELEFLKLWTRKESILKAHGTGLSYPLSMFCVIDDPVELDGASYHINTFAEKDYVVSVAHREGKKLISPEIITLTPFTR